MTAFTFVSKILSVSSSGTDPSNPTGAISALFTRTPSLSDTCPIPGFERAKARFPGSIGDVILNSVMPGSGFLRSLFRSADNRG